MYRERDMTHVHRSTWLMHIERDMTHVHRERHDSCTESDITHVHRERHAWCTERVTWLMYRQTWLMCRETWLTEGFRRDLRSCLRGHDSFILMYVGTWLLHGGTWLIHIASCIDLDKVHRPRRLMYIETWLTYIGGTWLIHIASCIEAWLTEALRRDLRRCLRGHDSYRLIYVGTWLIHGETWLIKKGANEI